MNTSPTTTSLFIPGPAGQLEALLDEPVETAGYVGVVCHPHPLYGGNLMNKVTHILARAFNSLGAPTIRFNFRGVGQSAGEHNDGRGEVEDTLAVIQWAEHRWPGAPIWLAGFSFGAAMALRASLQHPVERLVTVAPALRWLTQVNESPACPWLIVQGDADPLVDANAVSAWVATLAQPPELRILAGAEHFFHGRLNQLRDTVIEWLRAQMPTR